MIVKDKGVRDDDLSSERKETVVMVKVILKVCKNEKGKEISLISNKIKKKRKQKNEVSYS